MQIDRIAGVLSYLTGLFSLIFFPYFYGVKPIDLVFYLNLFYLLVLVILKPQQFKFYIFPLTFFFYSLVYFHITIFGSIINSPVAFLKSSLVAYRYAMACCVAFLFSCIYGEKAHYYFHNFLKGLITAGILNVFWIILDYIFYYFMTPGNSINEIIFGKMNRGLSHTLTNKIMISGILLFRSSGFGWDPSGIGPALVVVLIICDILKCKRRVKAIISTGIILTISKTALLGMLFYLFLKIITKCFYMREKQIISLAYILILVIPTFSFFIPYDIDIQEGIIRHLKYPGEVLKIFLAAPQEFLFGYGYRGTGEFFNRYSKWIESLHGFYFKEGRIAESTFANLFLYGGIFGAFYNLILYSVLVLKGGKFSLLVLAMLVMYIGYSFETVWTVFLVYFLFFLLTRGSERIK